MSEPKFKTGQWVEYDGLMWEINGIYTKGGLSGGVYKHIDHVYGLYTKQGERTFAHESELILIQPIFT